MREEEEEEEEAAAEAEAEAEEEEGDDFDGDDDREQDEEGGGGGGQRDMYSVPFSGFSLKERTKILVQYWRDRICELNRHTLLLSPSVPPSLPSFLTTPPFLLLLSILIIPRLSR